jgi:hypothetical protein
MRNVVSAEVDFATEIQEIVEVDEEACNGEDARRGGWYSSERWFDLKYCGWKDALFCIFSSDTTVFMGGMGKSCRPPGGMGCCCLSLKSRVEAKLFCMATIWRSEDRADCMLGVRSLSEARLTALSRKSFAKAVCDVRARSASMAESESSSAPGSVGAVRRPEAVVEGVARAAAARPESKEAPEAAMVRRASSMPERRSSMRSILRSLGVSVS